jgi:hypothetical protein
MRSGAGPPFIVADMRCRPLRIIGGDLLKTGWQGMVAAPGAASAIRRQIMRLPGAVITSAISPDLSSGAASDAARNTRDPPIELPCR